MTRPAAGDFPDFRVDGQVALVTGAARGLGRAIALTLANAGADVVLGLRDPTSGADLADEIEGLRHGRIINLSSQAGFVALPGESVYCMTKAAISHLTKCLAVEWGEHGDRRGALPRLARGIAHHGRDDHGRRRLDSPLT